MSSFTMSIVLFLFALTLSAAALTTPHVRDLHHHRALVARVAAPLPVAVPLTPRKRSLGKRCKSSNGTATSTSSFTSSSSSLAVPVDVAPDPTVTPPAKLVPSVSSDVTSTTKSKLVSSSRSKPTTTHHAPALASPPRSKPTTTHDAPAPAPTPGGPMAGTQTGDGTFYATGLGSCGITSQDSDDICAVSKLLYDSYPGYQGGDPNNNPVCGRYIKATYQGKSVTVKVVDRCEACAMGSLDFSIHAFEQLADSSVGRIHDMDWVWV